MLLGVALVLTPACAGVREPGVGAGPLAIVYVGNFGMRLRPEYRLEGDDGPSLALYPDGTFLRERLVDGEVKIVRGRISREAAASMIETLTRCMEPLADVTRVEPVSIRFHPSSMMLTLRPAGQDPLVRVFVDVEVRAGQIMIRDSEEYQAAARDTDNAGAGTQDTTPDPDFWPCLRPLLRIASNDETPWTPTTIALVLGEPRTNLRGSAWPREVPPPPRPREVHGATTLRHSVSYSHAGTLRDLLRTGRYVELHGHVWKVVDLWLPWPGQPP